MFWIVLGGPSSQAFFFFRDLQSKTGMEHKRDFGSFHVSNVQELLETPEEEYIPPKFPVDLPTFEEYKKQNVPFGKRIREDHFFLEDKVTFINHGAFGGVLREALETTQKCQIYVENQPLRFFDRELLPQMVNISRRLSKFVGCDPRDLVLVTNATTALNTVIRGINFQKGDTVFFLSTTYGAVKKLLKAISSEKDLNLHEVPLVPPVTDKQQIIDLIDSNLKVGTRLAIFDHIPSNFPLVMPLQEIIPICKKRGIPVLIDGAHALGSQRLDLNSLQPTYYVSNAHKWFCAPKGSAFLYVDKQIKHTVRPLIISHGYGSGFNSEFIWAGLHDYSPFLALHTVLNFWESLGENNIQKYMKTLLNQAAVHLQTVWKTRLAAPLEMFGPMALVQLPSQLYPVDKEKVDYSVAEAIQNDLYHLYNIEVPVKCIGGNLYVRISVHIYNEFGEYQYLGKSVLELAANRPVK